MEVIGTARTQWFFFRVAREVTAAMVPAYRTKGSKHIFTQPQLLTLVCLMRYEGWAFREIEEWVGKHRGLLRALELKRVPDHTTLFRFQKRIEEHILNRVLTQIIFRLSTRDEPFESNFRVITYKAPLALTPPQAQI